MKKFFAWLGGAMLLAVVVICLTFVIMAHVHDNTYKAEFYRWFPSLEKSVESEDTTKEEDVVVDDEIEEDNGEEIPTE